ncbi:DUF6233 domain-containing protein [Streptomyces sp. NPDC002730]|uniref:DUF6233 domain-containing protein n=1 Tax=Streptomyces sp. NPDC002730 TaxID=3364662 RepID=UPI0036867AC2
MSAAPPPPVLVVLPDGQELCGRLHERQQTSRAWMYRVGLPMWQTTAEAWVEPAEYVVWVPADYVRPIEDVDYDQVPTHRLPAAPAASPASGGARWAWKVQRLPHRGGRPGGIVVHVHDCEEAPAGGDELDLDQALTTLRRPGAAACKKCGAAEALTPLA